MAAELGALQSCGSARSAPVCAAGTTFSHRGRWLLPAQEVAARGTGSVAADKFLGGINFYVKGVDIQRWCGPCTSSNRSFLLARRKRA